MLTRGIRDSYDNGVEKLSRFAGVKLEGRAKYADTTLTCSAVFSTEAGKKQKRK